MKNVTFPKGGIHPPDHKNTSQNKTEILPLPDTVILLLGQHLGRPAAPVVEKGAQVKTGTLVAESTGFISANIHSPVSGTVLKIDRMKDISGYPLPAIVIKRDGDQWEPSIDRSPGLVKEIQTDAESIIEILKDKGIVGKGGACFPTHVKFMIPEGKTADKLIINAVECEPYLTVDHRLMLERSDELCVGMQILAKAAGIKEVYVGIEKNKPDAIEVMKEKSRIYSGGSYEAEIRVVPLEVKYPQGAEKQLIKAVTGREVRSGELPLDQNVIVNNIATVFVTYEAVQKHKPYIERCITVSGEHAGKPGNYLVRIGTPLDDLIKWTESAPEKAAKIISGGPMMGKAVLSTETPTVKGMSGILLLDEKTVERKPLYPCIRCGKCVDVCPMGLEPYLLEQLGHTGKWDDGLEHHAQDCIECGSCRYICPSSRPLIEYIRLAKKEAMTLLRNQK